MSRPKAFTHACAFTELDAVKLLVIDRADAIAAFTPQSGPILTRILNALPSSVQLLVTTTPLPNRDVSPTLMAANALATSARAAAAYPTLLKPISDYLTGRGRREPPFVNVEAEARK